jgi:PAS domain S-box-containing protein
MAKKRDRLAKKNGMRKAASPNKAPLAKPRGAPTRRRCRAPDSTPSPKHFRSPGVAHDSAGDKNRYLSAIVESSSDAIIGKTLEGIITSWNKGAERIYGYKMPEIIGRSISLLVPDGMEDEIPRILERIRKGERVDHFESVRRKKDGKIISVSITVSPVRDTRGKIVGASVIARDITAHKQMEEALQKSEAQYRFLSEYAADVIWKLDTSTGKFTYVSPSVQKLRGYAPEEVMAQHLSEALTPDSFRYVVRMLEKRKPEILQRGSGVVSYVDEVDQPHKDGSVIPTEVTTTYLLGENKKIEIVGVTRDISSRRQAEMALRESEEKFRRLLESIPVPVAYSNKDGIITFRNKRFVHVFGYTIDEVPTVAEWWLKAYPEPHYRQRVIHNWDSAVRHAIESGTDIESDEYRVVCKDGSVREVIISGANIDGNLLVTFVDITERKRAEEALREGAKEREKLIRDLQFALDNVKTLQGLIPICSSCKKIRDDKGYWNQVEEYIIGHTDATFTHGICPDCAQKLYGDLHKRKESP